MNIEMAIKLFARISIAEWLLTNTFYIIDAIFSAATWLIGKVLTGGVKKMSLSKAQLKLFEEVDPIESIVLLIFGFICLVVVIVFSIKTAIALTVSEFPVFNPKSNPDPINLLQTNNVMEMATPSNA